MLTLRGTPVLYYGEEIGMTDLLLTDVRQFRDMLGIMAYQLETEVFGTPAPEAVIRAARFGRDKCRTPMQWANASNAGFSPAGVQSWLPVNPNYAQGVNVADQLADPDSLLHFYQRLLHVRRHTLALIGGDYTPLHEEAQDYLAFLRSSQEDHQTCLVVLNMSDRGHTLTFNLPMSTAHVIFSSRLRDSDTDDLTHLVVAPFEVYIAKIT